MTRPGRSWCADSPVSLQPARGLVGSEAGSKRHGLLILLNGICAALPALRRLRETGARPDDGQDP